MNSSEHGVASVAYAVDEYQGLFEYGDWGDAGTVTPQQQKLLQEAYNSSERMVRLLIADFLNVSRLQTGKFIVDKAPIDMKDVVRSEVKKT